MHYNASTEGVFVPSLCRCIISQREQVNTINMTQGVLLFSLHCVCPWALGPWERGEREVWGGSLSAATAAQPQRSISTATATAPQQHPSTISSCLLLLTLHTEQLCNNWAHTSFINVCSCHAGPGPGRRTSCTAGLGGLRALQLAWHVRMHTCISLPMPHKHTQVSCYKMATDRGC